MSKQVWDDVMNGSEHCSMQERQAGTAVSKTVGKKRRTTACCTRRAAPGAPQLQGSARAGRRCWANRRRLPAGAQDAGTAAQCRSAGLPSCHGARTVRQQRQRHRRGA